MSNFRDMPLDTIIQKGDIITFTGPGEHDVTTREITQKLTFVEILTEQALTRVQRPVPALPTVEGDYIFTFVAGFRAVYALRGGVWLDAWGGKLWGEEGGGCWVAEQLEAGATFTRVIPAEEPKHPKVHVGTVCAEFLNSYLDGSKLAIEVFEDVLLRVLDGEFDL